MQPAHRLLIEAQEDLIFCFFFFKDIQPSSTPPIHHKEITLFSKLILVQYKQLLCATSFRTQGFFLCLSLSRSSLFIHTDLLACLPDFLFAGGHHSWAWRHWIQAHHLGKNKKKKNKKPPQAYFFHLSWISLEHKPWHVLLSLHLISAAIYQNL